MTTGRINQVLTIDGQCRCTGRYQWDSFHYSGAADLESAAYNARLLTLRCGCYPIAHGFAIFPRASHCKDYTCLYSLQRQTQVASQQARACAHSRYSSDSTIE